jgi:hypothetical protein
LLSATANRLAGRGRQTLLYLRHTVCRSDISRTETVTVHLDLWAGDRRTGLLLPETTPDMVHCINCHNQLMFDVQ